MDSASIPTGLLGNDGVPMLSIFVSRTPPRATVAIVGELDVAGAERIAEAIELAANQEEVLAVDVEVAGITFIDVAGLSALLQIGDALINRGKRFAVSPLEQSPVGHILALTQLGLDSRWTSRWDAPHTVASPS